MNCKQRRLPRPKGLPRIKVSQPVRAFAFFAKEFLCYL